MILLSVGEKMKNMVFATQDESTKPNSVTWTTDGDLNSGSTESFDTWEETLVWSFEKALELMPCTLTLDSPKFRHRKIMIEESMVKVKGWGFNVTAIGSGDHILVTRHINLLRANKGQLAMMLLEIEEIKAILLKISSRILPVARSVNK